MKKTRLLYYCLFIALPAASHAQLAFQKDDNLASLGCGIGTTYWGSHFLDAASPIANYEKAVSSHVGIGILAGYLHSSYSVSGPYFNDGDALYGFVAGFRISYHFATTRQFDPYASFDFGAISSKYKSYQNQYDTLPNAVSFTSYYESRGIIAAIGLHMGARYYVFKKVAIFAECGIATLDVFYAGISYKF